MKSCRNKSVGWIFATRMIGILCFLIIVVIANILTHYITSPLYESGVTFLNENFWLLTLIAIILLAADLFLAFPFPLNLPGPVIKAIGSVFCIAFMLQVFRWVDVLASTNIYQIFWLMSFLIVPLVFLIVIAGGYFEIMRQIWWKPKTYPDCGIVISHEEETTPPEQHSSDTKSWEEIGAEFRLAMYDLIHRFRDEVKRK